MRSKIQISVTEESKPCILVEYLESQDVRDTLVKQFKEGFQSVSSLCKVEFRDNQMIITPVAPQDLKKSKELHKTNSVSSTGGDNMSVTYSKGDSITYTK